MSRFWIFSGFSISRRQPWRCFGTVRSGKVSIDMGAGSLEIESGSLARFADGCAVCKSGNTSVLVTAVSKRHFSPVNFLPLMVDFRRKGAAAGRIPTNFLRRELGPSDSEILTSRAIDRSVRALFPAGYSYETQIICNTLCFDGIADPTVLSINGASAALSLSDIPWNGPVGAVKIGLIDNEVVINPTRKQMTYSQLDLLLVGGGSKNVVMLEMGASDIAVQDVQRAIKVGMTAVEGIVKSISDLQKKIGKEKREVAKYFLPPKQLVEQAMAILDQDVRSVFADHSHDKISRDKALEVFRTAALEKLSEAAVAQNSAEPQDPGTMRDAIDRAVKKIYRNLVFETGVRCDGRTLTDLRPIACSVDLYNPLHGSALFQRGQSQVLCTVTFDSIDSAFKNDPISLVTGEVKEKRFMLHYEFPPYAVNEVGGDRRGRARRELGHGALAEKALRPLVPNNYPFTVRLTAEVLESNGSTSMASVCAGSMALMDSGVPISASAAGVAIGLLTQPAEDNETDYKDYRILTDILGIEDYLGDMDFKIAGTRKGLTALQLDLKVPGIPAKIVHEALSAAMQAKKNILDIMDKCIGAPREGPKESSPVSEELLIPMVKRSRFVGLGGYNIKKLEADTGVHVTTVDETKYNIFAPNQQAMNEAKEMIAKFLADDREPELEFGGVYKAEIVEIRDNGIMVTLFPNMAPVLLPYSQLDTRKVAHASALGFEVGQEVSVKYFGRDPVTGHIRLSRRVLQTPTVVPDRRQIRKKVTQNNESPWS